MSMIEFAQGFTGNPTTELYEFIGFILLVLSLATGLIIWNQMSS